MAQGWGQAQREVLGIPVPSSSQLHQPGRDSYPTFQDGDFHITGSRREEGTKATEARSRQRLSLTEGY